MLCNEGVTIVGECDDDVPWVVTHLRQQFHFSCPSFLTQSELDDGVPCQGGTMCSETSDELLECNDLQYVQILVRPSNTSKCDDDVPHNR